MLNEQAPKSNTAKEIKNDLDNSLADSGNIDDNVDSEQETRETMVDIEDTLVNPEKRKSPKAKALLLASTIALTALTPQTSEANNQESYTATPETTTEQAPYLDESAKASKFMQSLLEINYDGNSRQELLKFNEGVRANILGFIAEINDTNNLTPDMIRDGLGLLNQHSLAVIERMDHPAVRVWVSMMMQYGQR